MSPSTEHYVAVLAALGRPDGFIADWRLTRGCQYARPIIRDVLPCTHSESRHRCEVIGPHVRHRWSRHTMWHEKFGNAYPCWTITETGRSADRTPMVRIGL